MNGCAEWEALLSASLDGALSQDERRETDEHLAACAACRQRLLSMRALKHALARLPSRARPPGAVRAHVESLVYRDRRSGRRGLAVRLALVVSVVAAITAFLAGRRVDDTSSDPLADELAADHLHSLPEAMPAEVASDDPEETIRFFSGRVPFEPVAPRLPGARLVGGRLCKIQGRRVQLLFYRAHPGETISLFVSDQDLAGEGCRPARGLHVCGRKASGLTLLAVGGSPPGDLRRLLDAAAF